MSAMLAMVHPTVLDPAAKIAVEDALARAEEANAIAREIGWRGGEALVLLDSSYCYQAVGDGGRALESARRCLAIAREIEHRQWEAAALFALGTMAVDLHAFAAAHRLLAQASALAAEINSRYWFQFATLVLAKTHVYQRNLTGARATIDAVHAPDAPMRSWFDRSGWLVRAELALVEGEPARALAIVDDLIATTRQSATARAIPALWLVRGEALTAIGRFDDATACLREAASVARERQGRTLLWRILLALGRSEQGRAHRGEADRAFADAQAVLAQIAATLPEGAIPEFGVTSARAHYLAATAALFPAVRQPTALQAAKQAFGGLTARERDVAALIARGLSNRAIADELIVGERTVATHVTSILAKLHFSSRSQIAAWAVERGLTLSRTEIAGLASES
jgi:DNA-binding CsgD family transcriptional regulator